MTRGQRIHIVGGLATSLTGFFVWLACCAGSVYRFRKFETALESAEDIEQVTSAMQGVFSGPSWVEVLGPILIVTGFLYSLIVTAIWFIGSADKTPRDLDVDRS